MILIDFLFPMRTANTGDRKASPLLRGPIRIHLISTLEANSDRDVRVNYGLARVNQECPLPWMAPEGLVLPLSLVSKR